MHSAWSNKQPKHTTPHQYFLGNLGFFGTCFLFFPETSFHFGFAPILGTGPFFSAVAISSRRCESSRSSDNVDNSRRELSLGTMLTIIRDAIHRDKIRESVSSASAGCLCHPCFQAVCATPVFMLPVGRWKTMGSQSPMGHYSNPTSHSPAAIPIRRPHMLFGFGLR